MTDPLPPGWALTEVGKICKVEYGKGLSKKQRVETGEVEVFGSAGFSGYHDTSLVDEPIVIVGRKGNAGRVWVTQGPSWPIDTTYFLRPPHAISPKYLSLQLGHLDLVKKDSSTTIPSLRRPDLEATQINLAPLVEQQRIVAAVEEHFSRIDAAESAAQTALARLDTLRRAILTAAFSGHLVEPLNPRRTTDGLPVDWSLSTVGDMSDVQLGRQRSPDSHFGPHMRPYIRAANVTWSGLDLSDVKEMNFDPSETTNFQLRVGDIVLNEASGSPNEVGKPAIWRGEIEHCFFQNTLLRVRTRGPLIDYLYWHFYYLARLGKFGEAGRGVNIRHLGKQGLTNFPIVIAPLHDQKQIVAAIEDQFSRIDSAKAALERCLQRCNILRRSILAAAFSGQLVEYDPDDEPASVLLERIAAEQPKRHPRSKSV